MLGSELRAALRYALGSGVRAAQRLTGGDINDAYRLELDSGTEVFLKTNQSAPPELFPAEAHGLEWLRSAGAFISDYLGRPPASRVARALAVKAPLVPTGEVA